MSEHSGSSDDEYGPIASAWGSQVHDAPSNDSEPDVIASWRTLTDPNARIGPSGLGSGGLHRQGKNYKPVDEELILKHRKNGAGLASGGKQSKQKNLNGGGSSSGTGTGGDKKKRPNRSKGQRSQEQQQQRQDSSRHSTSGNRSTDQPTHNLPPTYPPNVKNNQKDYQQTTRLSSERRPPLATKSTWSNQSLVEKPFWETTSPKPSSSSSSSPSPSPSPSKNGPPSPWELQYKAVKKPTSPATEQLIETSWSKPSVVDHHSEKECSITTSQKSDMSRWAEWSPAAISSDNGWQSNKNWEHTLEDGWGQAPATSITTSMQPPQQINSNNLETKAADDNDRNSSATAIATATTRSDINYGWQGNSSRRNTTTTTIKDQQLQPTSAAATESGSRFSNPHRPKYSTRNGAKPLPVNYRANAPLAPPKQIAPPPLMDNPILITINVELEEGKKIPVEIRLHDDPKQLAYQFGRNHLIDSVAIIDALCNLFQTHKNNVMKRKRRKPL